MRKCYRCNSTKTYRNSWYNTKQGWQCKKCYDKHVTNPKWHKITNPNKLGIKSIQLYGYTNQRIGCCSLCKNNIFNGSCKQTHMHHKFYLRIIPWFGRIELCASCHVKKID